MMSSEHQDAMRIRQCELMDELDKFFDELIDESNKHRVYLAFTRIRAIKINDEVKE